MKEKRIRKLAVEELEVERINVVGKDDKVQLVISNLERLLDPVIAGKVLSKRKGIPAAGLIFYNDEGDECGGLVSGRGSRAAAAGLLFDQYKQDQIVGLTYSKSNGERQYGLKVWDRPDTPLPEVWESMRSQDANPFGALRIFIGRTSDGEALIRISDCQGKERLRIVVDEVPRLEFLDENGRVMYRLPPSDDTESGRCVSD
jgi:hypothetical protein